MSLVFDLGKYGALGGTQEKLDALMARAELEHTAFDLATKPGAFFEKGHQSPHVREFFDCTRGRIPYDRLWGSLRPFQVPGQEAKGGVLGLQLLEYIRGDSRIHNNFPTASYGETLVERKLIPPGALSEGDSLAFLGLLYNDGSSIPVLVATREGYMWQMRNTGLDSWGRRDFIATFTRSARTFT